MASGHVGQHGTPSIPVLRVKHPTTTDRPSGSEPRSVGRAERHRGDQDVTPCKLSGQTCTGDTAVTLIPSLRVSQGDRACLHAYLCVFLSVYLFVCLSVCLSACLSVCLSICLYMSRCVSPAADLGSQETVTGPPSRRSVAGL